MKGLYLRACRDNNCFRVRVLLFCGANVNWRNSGGSTGLHLAAINNHGELLEVLLAHPTVDVNMRNNLSWTPLMMACMFGGQEDIVRRLCQATNIKLNMRDDDGFTALVLAVIRNNPACVSAFKEVAGVNWNVKTYGGNCPLTWAVDKGYADILQTILSVPEPHLDLSVNDSSGRNIAQIAVEQSGGSRQQCLEILTGDRRVDGFWKIKDRNGDTPVMYCLKNNKIEMARYLINTLHTDVQRI